MFKKVSAISICVVLLVCLICPVAFAANSCNDVSMQPRYSDMFSIYATLDPIGNNTYSISGGASSQEFGRKVEVTVSVEQYTSTGWKVVSGWSWSASGTTLAQTGATRTFMSKASYRAHTVAKCYNSAGTAVAETVEAYSDIVNLF